MSVRALADHPEDANSYVTHEEADAFMAEHAHGEPWIEHPEHQAPALITATRLLDRQRLAGRPTEADQPLAWPRSGLTDEDGRDVPEDVVPERVKRAQMEWALLLVQGIGDPAEEAHSPDEVQIGPLRVVERMRGRTGRPDAATPQAVAAELRPWLMSATVRLRRA